MNHLMWLLLQFASWISARFLVRLLYEPMKDDHLGIMEWIKLFKATSSLRKNQQPLQVSLMSWTHFQNHWIEEKQLRLMHHRFLEQLTRYLEWPWAIRVHLDREGLWVLPGYPSGQWHLPGCCSFLSSKAMHESMLQTIGQMETQRFSCFF